MVGTIILAGTLVVAAAFILSSCDKPDEEERFTIDEVEDAVAQEQEDDQLCVESALVICTSFPGAESDSKMMKDQDSITMQSGAELNHKDIEFEPVFATCMSTYDKVCVPEIEGEEWQDYDDTTEVDDGYALIMEKSYMFCTHGCGMLYLTEDGQEVNDMEVLGASIIFDKWWNGEDVNRVTVEKALDILNKNNQLPDIAPHINIDQLLGMGYKLDRDDLFIVADLNRVLIKYDITTTERLRYFFSQSIVEIGAFNPPIEDGGSNPLEYFKKQDHPPYIGGGYIQVTWDFNYIGFSTFMILQKYPQLKTDEIYYLNPLENGMELLTPMYEQLKESAKKQGLDISRYTDIYELSYEVEDIYDFSAGSSVYYVATEFPWESAGYFWKVGNANEIVKEIDKKRSEGEESEDGVNYFVDDITEVINEGTSSYPERRTAYDTASIYIK